MEKRADIGVFGGTGLYSFLDDVEEIEMETPYGKPSDSIAIAEVDGKSVAFIPRHGKDHRYPPHRIPYRANIYAMKQLGVKYIIAPTASGSLKAEIGPGDFCIPDQLIDRTWGREDTFFNGPEVKHITFADPYDEDLRRLAVKVCIENGLKVHDGGVMVVIQGPRFSTRAESRWFSSIGGTVINMTQYPECVLAREMDIPYVNISIITDYDAGLEGHPEIKPVSHEEVLKVFEENNERIKKVLYDMIRKIEV
jgi:methylthioadenosine phosphorylase (EC 2.4.2.28)